MAKIESYLPGSMCWAELATPDTAGAKHFYTEMFGWTTQENPMPDGVYTIFQSEGNDAAAMTPPPPGVPPHWGVYFSTANADDSAAKVKELGGNILMGPFDVMEHGRMAVAQDPQGAVFCLWQAKNHIGATHGGPLNVVCWPELKSPDPDSAISFYSRLFGWEWKRSSSGEEYFEWYLGGHPMGAMLPMRGDEWKGVPPHWGIYITVADCDERAAKAKELGASFHVPPTDIPNVGRFAVIADPQGVVFAIIQLNLQSNG